MVPAERSQSMREPWAVRKATSLFRSVMSGTFRRVTGSSVSKVAQKIGNTEFLLPEGTMVPESGLPPCTMRSDMGGKFGKGEIRKFENKEAGKPAQKKAPAGVADA